MREPAHVSEGGQSGGKGRTLIMTVGGSPQPLRSALEAVKPDRVVFVVSDRGGGVSSRVLVEAEDEQINYGTDQAPRMGPGLRHLSCCPRDVAVVEIPADDLDEALTRIDARIARELREGRQVIADYTGGTKTMTAALVLAATAYEDVDLQFMAGARPDLRQVEPGSEQPVRMPRHLIGLAQLFALARSFAGRRLYQAALSAVEEAQSAVKKAASDGGLRVPTPWTRRIESWRRFLAVLDHWDRFDHRKAERAFRASEDHGLDWARTWRENGFADRLEELVRVGGKPSFLLVEDLWLNAERRAAVGQYDDAIARLYRLSEAAVQAHLFAHHGIDNSRVPPERLPECLRRKLSPSSDCKTGEPFFRLALSDAKALLRYLEPNSELYGALGGDKSPEWQTLRNRSILAHGFRPSSEQDWQRVRDWFEERRDVLWEKPLGRGTLEQLPNELPFT